jgi:hypothetical protein
LRKIDAAFLVLNTADETENMFALILTWQSSMLKNINQKQLFLFHAHNTI